MSAGIMLGMGPGTSSAVQQDGILAELMMNIVSSSSIRHMARALLPLLCLLVSPNQSHTADFRLGVQLSGGNNSLTGDLPKEGSWKGQSVPGAGLVAEWGFTPDVALSFQPAYTPRSAQQVFRNSQGLLLSSIDYDIDFVSLPLIVRVTGDPIGVRGFVTAGLDLSILVDASKSDGNSTEDISETFQSTTVGALFGAGVMVPVKRHFLTFEFRYTQGLKDMLVRDESQENPDFSSPSVKYRGFHLMVGFLFSLGGGD